MAKFKVGDKVRIGHIFKIINTNDVVPSYLLDDGGWWGENFLEPAEAVSGGSPDAVNHPDHYCDGGIETIDFIRAKLTAEEFIGYCKGNALKYISRAGKKGEAVQDIRKAITYLNWLVGDQSK